MPSSGSYYSWSNKGQGADRIASRIDRCFANGAWFLLYDQVKTLYLAPDISDHSPLLLEFLPQCSGGGRPFRFFNLIADHADFQTVVQDHWSIPMQGTYMYKVWHKLKEVKKGVKRLHCSKFASTDAEIIAAQNSLYEVQDLLAQDISNAQLQQQEALELENLQYWTSAQESIYKQKSRVNWLQLGDSNTKFFFAAMKHRFTRNRILTLCNDAGDTLSDPALIKDEILKFYKALLGTAASSLTAVDITTVRAGKALSVQARNFLVQEVTNQEIDLALAAIDDNKAPGIYGFNARFFKKAWDIVKTCMLL